MAAGSQGVIGSTGSSGSLFNTRSQPLPHPDTLSSSSFDPQSSPTAALHPSNSALGLGPPPGRKPAPAPSSTDSHGLSAKRPRAGTLPSTFYLGSSAPGPNQHDVVGSTLSSASGLSTPSIALGPPPGLSASAARPEHLRRRLSGLPLGNHSEGSALGSYNGIDSLTQSTGSHGAASQQGNPLDALGTSAALDGLLTSGNASTSSSTGGAPGSELRASLLLASQPVTPDPVAAARLRSGSLTLPPSGLGNAFTPGVFGPPGSWTPRSSGLGTPLAMPTTLSVEDTAQNDDSGPVSPNTDDAEATASIGGILNFLNLDDSTSGTHPSEGGTANNDISSSSLSARARAPSQSSSIASAHRLSGSSLLAAPGASRHSGSISVPSSTHPSMQNLREAFQDHGGLLPTSSSSGNLLSEHDAALNTMPSGSAGGLSAASRLRANTVAAPDPLLRRSSPYHLSTNGSLSTMEGAPYISQQHSPTTRTGLRTLADLPGEDAHVRDATPVAGQQNAPPGEPYAHGNSSAYLLSHLNRPRASTIGILDEAAALSPHRKRAGTTTGPGMVQPTRSNPRTPLYEGNADGFLGVPRMHAGEDEYGDMTGTWPSQEAAYESMEPSASYQQQRMYAAMHHPAMSGTEGRSSGTPTPLQASRSLWIGNLDPRITASDLYNNFGIYGAIETIRVLNEKDCAFVNYMSVHDAINAKDDILNRLGGQIHTVAHGNFIVRIGFGKADSLPPTPASVLQARPAAQTAGVSVAPSGTSLAGSIEAQLQTSPTRALWIGSIPASTSNGDLLKAFSPFGPIESARVLVHKQCGFVNFENLDDAVRARTALNGLEILGPEIGPVKIGYAKVPSKTPLAPVCTDEGVNPAMAYAALAKLGGATAVPLEEQISSGNLENFRSPMALTLAANGLNGVGPHSAIDLQQSLQPVAGLSPRAVATEIASAVTSQSGVPMPSVSEQQVLLRDLTGDPNDPDAESPLVVDGPSTATYYTTIPPAMEEHQQNRMRHLDAPRLRDIRKRLEAHSTQISQAEIDALSSELLDDIVPLASDYIGNVIVQKLFEKCSSSLRLAMLERIAPFLATIACHKNGTWAAQKIIDIVSTPQEIALVCQHLRPFIPPLLLDQFGNYAAQLCLRFFSPVSDFLFDAMVDRCWEIASGRFGARSMRTCLEAANASPLQQKRVAIAIILNSVLLATNPNGALLLTWLLDTSGFNGRYRLLSTRLLPHLAQLCPHKVASTTILKIVNQKYDPSSSKRVVEAILSSPEDTILKEILAEQVHGSSFMHKLLSSAHLDVATREAGAAKVKKILQEGQPHHSPAYAKLCHEIGLPIPAIANQGPPQSLHLSGKSHTQQHHHPQHIPGGRDMPGGPSYAAQLQHQHPYHQHHQPIHQNYPPHSGPQNAMSPPPFSFPSFGSPLSPPARLIPSAAGDASNGHSYGQRQPPSLEGQEQSHFVPGHIGGTPDQYGGMSYGLAPSPQPRVSPNGSSPRNHAIMPGLGTTSGPLPNAYVEQYLQNVAALQMSGFNGVGNFAPPQGGIPPHSRNANSSSPPYTRGGVRSNGPHPRYY